MLLCVAIEGENTSLMSLLIFAKILEYFGNSSNDIHLTIMESLSRRIGLCLRKFGQCSLKLNFHVNSKMK